MDSENLLTKSYSDLRHDLLKKKCTCPSARTQVCMSGFPDKLPGLVVEKYNKTCDFIFLELERQKKRLNEFHALVKQKMCFSFMVFFIMIWKHPMKGTGVLLNGCLRPTSAE